MTIVKGDCVATEPSSPSMFSFLTGWQLPTLESYFSERRVSPEDLSKSETSGTNNAQPTLFTIGRSTSTGSVPDRKSHVMPSRLNSLGSSRTKAFTDFSDEPSPSLRKKTNRREMLSDILGQGYVNINSHYVIGKKIGRSKFGNVHLAIDRKTQERVLCKSIAKSELLLQKDVNAVKTEIAIMLVLKQQPNVVRHIQEYEDGQFVHLIMEWCSGDELLDLIVSKGKYSEREAASVFRSIMDIVKTCHFLGIMLRNIQLENFRYSSKKRDGVIKCVDLSEAVIAQPGETFKDFVGSLNYMAPEVLFRKYGIEADIWSCGVILHILLSGDPPFSSERDSDAFQHIIDGTVTFKTGAWSHVSEQAKDLTRKMLTRNPSKRITAKQVLEHPWLSDGEVEAVETLLDPSVFVRLKKIASVSKMKRLACQVMVKRLPKSELEKLKSIYGVLDQNGDGSLSYSELREGLKKVGINMTAEETETLLEAVDVDKGGFIDYNEFLSAMLSVRKTFDVTDLARAFHFFDSDDNGYITVTELQKALQDDYDLDPGEAEHMVKMADVDGNGKLDFEEFVAMMEK